GYARAPDRAPAGYPQASLQSRHPGEARNTAGASCAGAEGCFPAANGGAGGSDAADDGVAVDGDPRPFTAGAGRLVERTEDRLAADKDRARAQPIPGSAWSHKRVCVVYLQVGKHARIERALDVLLEARVSARRRVRTQGRELVDAVDAILDRRTDAQPWVGIGHDGEIGAECNWNTGLDQLA